MAGGEEGTAGDTVLQSLPLVVATEPPAMARPRVRFAVPKIIDYLIVAAFMYFML